MPSPPLCLSVDFFFFLVLRQQIYFDLCLQRKVKEKPVRTQRRVSARETEIMWSKCTYSVQHIVCSKSFILNRGFTSDAFMLSCHYAFCIGPSIMFFFSSLFRLSFCRRILPELQRQHTQRHNSGLCMCSNAVDDCFASALNCIIGLFGSYSSMLHWVSPI